MRKWKKVTACMLLASMGACSVEVGELEEQRGPLLPDNDRDSDVTLGEGPAIAAANNASLAQRDRDLAKKYPNERGQSPDYQKTLYASLLDIYTTSKNDQVFTNEYCSHLYEDKWGYWYYTTPAVGQFNPSENRHECRPIWPPARPEIKQRDVLHSHVWESKVTSDLDMLAALGSREKVWTILSNGEIYVYKPGEVQPQLFGKVDKGHIITAYNSIYDVDRPGFDPYAPQPEDEGGGIWSSVWKGLVAAWAISGAVAAAILGGASTPGSSCCAGPPASGYDPASDPTQVCRRADGSSCT